MAAAGRAPPAPSGPGRTGPCQGPWLQEKFGLVLDLVDQIPKGPTWHHAVEAFGTVHPRTDAAQTFQRKHGIRVAGGGLDEFRTDLWMVQLICARLPGADELHSGGWHAGRLRRQRDPSCARRAVARPPPRAAGAVACRVVPREGRRRRGVPPRPGRTWQPGLRCRRRRSAKGRAASPALPQPATRRPGRAGDGTAGRWAGV